MKEKFIDFRGKVHTFFKEKTRFKARKYNDYLLIGVLLFLLLCMECALLIYNNFENVNVFGIFNDALIYFCILWLINAIQNIKAKKIFFGLFFSLTAVLFIVDTVFIEMFGHCFSVASLSAAGNVLKQDNFILFNKSTFIIIGIAVIGIASLFIVELRTQNRKNIIIKHVSIFMALAVALTVFNVTSVGSIKGRQYDDTLEYLSSDTFLYINFYSSKKFVSRFGYVLFKINDINRATAKASTAYISDVVDVFNKREKKEKNNFSGLLKDYNIITIMAETLDTRIINPVLTPNLYSLMEDSFVFDNYFTPTFFEGATINSQFMAQTGMLPVTSNIWSNNFGNKYPHNYFGDYSLAGQLGKNGYQTYFFHNYMKEFYRRDTMMPNLGFENAKFSEDLYELGYTGIYQDSSILGFFENFVDYESKFYVDVLTYSMHGGYDELYAHNLDFVNQNFPNLNHETAVYFSKAVETDKFFGLLIEFLEQKGVLGKTAIFIYPDHYAYGMPSLYNSYLDINISNKEIHRQNLIMYIGGEVKQTFSDMLGETKVNLLSSTIDLPPTIMNLACDNAEYRYMTGNDIFDDNNIIFFSDLTVYNGRTFLNVDGTLTGLVSDMADLVKNLDDRIKLCGWYAIMYDSDYFFQLLNIAP